MDTKPDVRFVPPVSNKDQSRVTNTPLFPGAQTFNTNSPILDGAFATLSDKAFGK